MILQTAMNVLKLIIVAKMASVLTRWAHMDVTVRMDTDNEWGPQGGIVQVIQHIPVYPTIQSDIILVYEYLFRSNRQCKLLEE